MDLTGRVVLITGARRVGSKLALDLADREANIALTYHTSQPAIEQTAADVRARGVAALTVAADLSRGDQAEATVRQVVERFGRIDALVNMASTYTRTPFDSLKPNDFDAMIAANLAAVYHVAVAAGQTMRTQDPLVAGRPLRGKIVTVGDWATDRPYRHYLPYLVAKGGAHDLDPRLGDGTRPGRRSQPRPARDDRTSTRPLPHRPGRRDRRHSPGDPRHPRRCEPLDPLFSRRNRLRDWCLRPRGRREISRLARSLTGTNHVFLPLFDYLILNFRLDRRFCLIFGLAGCIIGLLKVFAYTALSAGLARSALHEPSRLFSPS